MLIRLRTNWLTASNPRKELNWISLGPSQKLIVASKWIALINKKIIFPIRSHFKIKTTAAIKTGRPSNKNNSINLTLQIRQIDCAGATKLLIDVIYHNPHNQNAHKDIQGYPHLNQERGLLQQ